MWRAPGSPDEFGPEILAGEPRVRWGTPIRGVPLENWGGMGRLWSVDRAACDAGSLTCNVASSMVCEDTADAEIAAAFPWAIFEPVPPPATGAGSSPSTFVAQSSGATPPAGAFSDEGPGVAGDATMATMAMEAKPPVNGEANATDGAFASVVSSRAEVSYCSYEEPTECACTLAALGPPAPGESAGLPGPSVVE
jgi:hypothetical protein